MSLRVYSCRIRADKYNYTSTSLEFSYLNPKDADDGMYSTSIECPPVSYKGSTDQGGQEPMIELVLMVPFEYLKPFDFVSESEMCKRSS